MIKRKIVTLAMCVTLIPAVALSACSGDKGDESSKIVVGIPQDLEDSLDPHEAVAAGTKEILFNVYEGLLKPDETGNLVPAVAKEYSVSDDGLVYSFVLRDGVKFHNGKEVTAEDVKYSIEKSAGMTGAESLIAPFSNIKEVNVIGKDHFYRAASILHLRQKKFQSTYRLPTNQAGKLLAAADSSN